MVNTYISTWTPEADMITGGMQHGAATVDVWSHFIMMKHAAAAWWPRSAGTDDTQLQSHLHHADAKKIVNI